MDAQERARTFYDAIWMGKTLEQRSLITELSEQIRQAEQAARDEGYNSGYIEGHIAGVKESRVKALEEAAVTAESEDMWQPTARLIAAAIRALKET